MIRHTCSACKMPLPPQWNPVATRTCESLCPECAAKEMRAKAARRGKQAGWPPGVRGFRNSRRRTVFAWYTLLQGSRLSVSRRG